MQLTNQSAQKRRELESAGKRVPGEKCAKIKVSMSRFSWNDLNGLSESHELHESRDGVESDWPGKRTPL